MSRKAQQPPCRLHRTIATAALAALGVLHLPTELLADTVKLLNGDRLTGRIVSMEEGRLKLETTYAGTLLLPWAEVAALQSDSTLKLRLADGTMIPADSFARGEDAPKVTQINPAAWQTGDGHLLKGEAALSLKLDRGNSRQDEADIDAALEWRHLRHRVKLSGELEYDRAEGERTTDQWFLLGKYDYRASRHYYYGGKAEIRQDHLTGLEHRFTTGPYIGRQFIDTPATKLSGELGIDYVDERYTDDGASGSSAAGSWSVDFSHDLIANSLQLYHRQKGLADIDDPEGVVLDTWTGLKVPIRGGFSTSAEVKADYSGNAADGADPWDFTYRMKFGYAW